MKRSSRSQHLATTCRVLTCLSLLLAGVLTCTAQAAEKPRKKDISTIKVPGLKDGIRMIGLRGGDFVVSADNRERCGTNTRPAHQVTLKPFALASTEVSFDLWDLCVAKGGCSHSPESPGWGRGAYPVIDVSHEDAEQLIAWLNRTTERHFRLPTADEWEYAARTGLGIEDIPAAASDPAKVSFKASSLSKNPMDWHTSFQSAVPVGSLPANAWGLHEMAGNVWEWTSDCGCDHGPTEASASSSPYAPGCDLRLVRGGSYTSNADSATPVSRMQFWTWFRAGFIGFRLAEDWSPGKK